MRFNLRLKYTFPVLNAHKFQTRKFATSIVARNATDAESSRIRSLFLKGSTGQIAFAQSVEQIPDYNETPQVALIGRTNVGKTSLIGSLLLGAPSKQKGLKPSKRPGSTKALVFHSFKRKASISKEMILVDLPGYGYGSHIDQGKMIEKYLSSSTNLRAVFILIDMKVMIKSADLMVMDLLNRFRVPWYIVGTKWDKVKGSHIPGRELEARTKLLSLLKDDTRLYSDEILVTSSQVPKSVDNLRLSIFKKCGLSI
ncbi:P-loop containing nucleoside triphosphate hydrolase protein [Myxozyma melibiosi]|uniref:P-loop containing nucleoside triphosphate hydrolase protein n=1 Tax=Myxozyma melibiosi TaxID=54550 RepID=A0ABR1F812_9ASCO